MKVCDMKRKTFANLHPQEAGKLLTVNEVAHHCQVSERTVRRWTQKGELAVVRLGRLVRVAPDALNNFIGRRIGYSPSPVEIKSGQ
jgi:excisionase family DNA binding protein